MKYWSDDFIEERNIHEGQFRSLISTPALMGVVLDAKNNEIATYELEIVKEPCALKKRIDTKTYENVTDMCVMVDYRVKYKGIDGESVMSFPVPLDELTIGLQNILINAHLIM